MRAMPCPDAGRHWQADISSGAVPGIWVRTDVGTGEPTRSAPREADFDMTITVHLFAAARDLVGRPTVPVELPAGATVALLRVALRDRCPALASLLARSAVAVNQEYAEDSVVLSQ